MHSVEMNISILQQSQVQSKPDLQPAAVKNPKFRKGSKVWKNSLMAAITINGCITKVCKGDEGKTPNKNPSEYFSLKQKNL